MNKKRKWRNDSIELVETTLKYAIPQNISAIKWTTCHIDHWSWMRYATGREATGSEA